ncbi:fructokinase [Clostridium saccharoperbutylacetonicum]|uniref:Sugar kinase, ribokinase family n=1 Tax=Clostridium saccharoperbutylacetonicum N1-4(HMT) TaxID=931276 RepID=M1LRG1_9CLOT|nr:carbohydrate kinase family protein [Clostridium saccharoperbutylacetonicum]AGF55525.1 sugar kinase, ribokinase family [Clostridium saccharoperbutylacetonicum N1-4(HMT)]NRT63756.1 fructokinase [Clostridium saccharoperbutylacetonicum]NSB27119.1 fructokinase [Clostridium saccharoperbutylacetonicum]NSB40605.1 fructokinase [Clostridium saccharoperbutylacetonicum]
MIYFNEVLDLQEKKFDIFTIGELLIDMISNDYSDNFQCNNYTKYFGGSPANIAMNAKKLGAESVIASSVGKDGLGDFLIQHLENNHIDTSYISRVDFPTSMVLVTKSKTTPVPIFYRGADYNLPFDSKLKSVLNNTKIVHFSCWPISQKNSRETIEKVIVEARKNKVLIGFDPNYHEMIWEHGHDGIKYIKDLISKVDIIKPSEIDAERIFGSDIPENQVKKFIDLGVKLVIMTLGKDGAIVSNGLETIRFETLAKEVVDTTGAGDAFWSGFYTSIIKGYSIREALNLGFAVSAYKLKYVGAVVNLPTIEELKSTCSI